MVAKPWEWIWSSAREHLNLEKQGIISLETTSSYLYHLGEEYIDIDDRPGDFWK